MHHDGEDLTGVLTIREGEKTPDLPDWDKDFFDNLSTTQLLSVVKVNLIVLSEFVLTLGCRIFAN